MRVVIDASSLLLRSAGVKNYFYHWLLHMRALAGADAIRAFPFIGKFGELDHERSLLSPASTYPRLLAIYLAKFGFSPFLEFCALGADVFHVSNMVRNPPRRTKFTATAFDLTCRLMPELHTAANIKADEGFQDRILKRADGLIAISDSTRNDVIRLLRVDPRKVCTIYPGVPETFFTADPRKSKRPYILSVGTIEPRKNIDTLLDAWESLPAFIHEEYDLVIVGARGWHSETTNARLNSGIPGVRHLGYIPEADLPGLTAGATAVVYPSLYEGFGFPVAQAMAASVPVITSNVSSLPEVTGDGGIMVDPRSVSELRDAMDLMLTSPALRERLADNARKRAEMFRWERCAAESLNFFERVCG